VFLDDFIVPILYGVLLAMLFAPICRYLEGKGIHRSLAIGICLLIVTLVIGLVCFLLYTQLIGLAKDVHLFRSKAEQKFGDALCFVERVVHISEEDQRGWLKDHYEKMLSLGTGIFRSLLQSLSSGAELSLIVLVYLFLFLFTRTRIKDFILMVLPQQNPFTVLSVMSKTETVTRRYMSGVLKLILLMGVLNTLGFMICGVKHAIFWGIFRGLLNAIPYVGPIIGAIFPFLSSLVYTEGWMQPLGVAIVVVVTQLIQDYYILPVLVGSNIKLNPLTTIMAVLVGNLIWGVHGMILLLPLIGVLKVLFDHVPSLHALGYLLGDEKNKENRPDS
jgi:predicted PurR-regulated permease PerM